MVDGLGSNIVNYLSHTKKFFGEKNYFNNVWANSNWTLPSYGNFITGKYAANHKCYNASSFYNNSSNISYKTDMNIYEYFSK